MAYPITKNLIANLPKNPFRYGASAYEGVVAHSTATPEATAANERNYEFGHWQDAFVHFFVDWNGIVQTADTDYIAWHAGHTANQRYVGVELCETADANLFAQSYARYTWLLAYILYNKRLGVTHGKTFFTHAETSALFKETNHSDPVGYLSSHGVSVDQLVADVTAEYDKWAGPPSAPKHAVAPASAFTTLSVGSTGENVKFVQRFLGIPQDGVYGPQTKQAVINYQKMRGLQADGIVGPVTWANMHS